MISDEERLRRLAHDFVGHRANMEGLVQNINAGLYYMDDVIWILEGEVLWLKEQELRARGADDAARELHQERQDRYRAKYPLPKSLSDGV